MRRFKFGREHANPKSASFVSNLHARCWGLLVPEPSEANELGNLRRIGKVEIGGR